MLGFKQLENIGFIHVRDLICCNSPYGEERVRNMRFYAPGEEATLQTELDNIALAARAYADMPETLSDLEHAFMLLKDVRRSIAACGSETLSEIALFEIKRFLTQFEAIAALYGKISRVFPFDGIFIEPEPLAPALRILTPDNTDTAAFHISSAYSERLADIREKKRGLELQMRNTANQQELAALQSARQAAVAEEEDEERRIRGELSRLLAPYKDAMLTAADMIGRLDFLLTKAKLAAQHNAVKPDISEDMCIELEDMINPEVDSILSQSGRSFTPVSIELSRGATVITGANMGGKSVALKTVALNVILFHAGMYVFAKRARIPLLNHITLISEELEDTKRGLSSFGGEIQRLKEELGYARERSLMLFDEFARGTNPEEGAKIVRVLLKRLNRENAISVLTTHYDGVAGCARAHYRVIGLRDFSVEDAVKNGESGISAIARHMNYGIYRADNETDCPRDALSICRLILHGEDVLEELVKEYEE